MNAIIRSTCVALVVVLLGPKAIAQVLDLSGHWEGSVTAPMGELQFAFDLSKDAEGKWKGTYSQPQQRLQGLPLSAISVDGRTVRLVIGTGSSEASFVGELLSDGKSVMGQASSAMGSAPFTMGHMGDAVVAAQLRSAAVSRAVEGEWQGALEAGGRSLRITLSIANQPDGTATATMASVDQGFTFPVSVTQTGANLVVDIRVNGGSYTASLNDAGTELTGTFAQGPMSAPLTMRRAGR